MTTAPHIVYVTAGTDGAGHLMRGMAIGRALAATGLSHRYTLLAPASPYAHVAGPSYQAVEIRPAELRDPRSAVDSALGRAIADLAPTLVVLDLFWVPLVFVPVTAPVWLLLRSVPAAWLRGPVEARFDSRRYERVFAIEDAPGLDAFDQLPPIVWNTEHILRSRNELAARLQIRPDDPIRLVVRAGLETDDALLDAACEDTGGEGWVSVRLGQDDAPCPLGPWLAGLRDGDQVVAGAGYNFYWESHHFGFYPRVRWVPLPRRIDDQHWRAARAVAALDSCDGAATLAAALVARCRD